MQLGIDLLTFTAIGLLRDPVCHVSDWDDVRPWPRSLPAGRGPDRADDRTPDEEADIYLFFAVYGWCLVICKGLKGQPHGIQSTERPRL